MFISLDPISAMHLGLSNDPLVMRRAELMAQYILRQVPNHLLDEQCEENRASLDLAAHQHIHDHLQRLQSELSPDPLENSLQHQRAPQVFNSDKYHDGEHVMAFSPSSIVHPNSTATDVIHFTTESNRSQGTAALRSRKSQVHPDPLRGTSGTTSIDRGVTNQRLRDAAHKVIHPDEVEAQKVRHQDAVENQILEDIPDSN